MLFKGNSSRLELLIGKIQAHKEPSQDEQHKSKGPKITLFCLCPSLSLFLFLRPIFFFFLSFSHLLPLVKSFLFSVSLLPDFHLPEVAAVTALFREV